MNEQHSSDNGAASLLAVSIGNTSTRIAALAGGNVLAAERLETAHLEHARPVIERLCAELPPDAPVVVASVVPAALTQLQAAVEADAAVLVIGETIDFPIAARVERPDYVGVDRLCCAAGAFARVGAACVVADFGTALTVDLVSDDGMFLGGTILPGLRLSARALHEHTALLPEVEILDPHEPVGENTVAAMQAGVFYGAIGALREITERIATKIGRWPTLIVSGGDARAIADAADFIDHVAPDLIFDGVAAAYAAHRRKRDDRD